MTSASLTSTSEMIDNDTPNWTKVELTQDVWEKVIGLLQRPRPAPTGNNVRSSIRQPELACLMRVSKLLNNLTSPFLYTAVVTDAFSLLLHNSGKSRACTGIQSKDQLLRFTKRLFLEYIDKGEPSYNRLLAEGGVLFDLLHAPSDTSMTAVCRAEALGIRVAAKTWMAQEPKLHTFATGAFLDSQFPIWERVFNREPDLEKDDYIGRAGQAISQLAIHIGHSTSCQRVEYGPLVFSPILHKEIFSGNRDRFSFRSHIEPRGPPNPLGPISCVTGGDSRWYIRWNAISGPRGQEEVRHNLKELVRRTLWFRHETFGEAGPGQFDRLYDNAPIDIDVYLPPCLTTGTNGLGLLGGTMARHISTCLKSMGVPDRRASKDSWRFKKMEQAPECEACGWHTEI